MCPPNKPSLPPAADTRRAGGHTVRRAAAAGPGGRLPLPGWRPFADHWRTQDAPGAILSTGQPPRAVVGLNPEGQKVILADKKRGNEPNVRQTRLFLSSMGINSVAGSGRKVKIGGRSSAELCLPGGYKVCRGMICPPNKPSLPPAADTRRAGGHIVRRAATASPGGRLLLPGWWPFAAPGGGRKTRRGPYCPPGNRREPRRQASAARMVALR